MKKFNKKTAKNASLSVPVVLCSSLEDLLFTDFMKCSCDQDYSCLIRSGTPTNEQVLSAWISIVSHYQTLTTPKEAEQHIALSAKIEALNTKIIIVSALVEGIKLETSDQLIQELKHWGYNYQFSAKTIEKDLHKVLAKLGNDKTKQALAIRNYQDKQEVKQAGDGGKATRGMYMRALSAIEEKKKMEFDLTRLTAYKFAILQNELIEYNQLIKSKYSHASK